MLKKYSQPLNKTFHFLDFMIVLFSLGVAGYSRFGSNPFNIFVSTTQYQIFVLFYIVAWLYLSNRSRLYGSRRFVKFRDEAWDVCKTIALCLTVALFPAFFIRQYPFSRIFLFSLWISQTAILIIFRFLLRETLRYIRSRGYNYRNVLIIGHNSRSAEMVQKMERTPELGLRILGYIDAENPNPCNIYDKTKRLGDLEDLEVLLKEEVVDEVFVFLPIKSFYFEIDLILKVCETAGIEVKIPTELFSLSLAKATISRYGDVSMIDLYTSPKMNWQFLMKRIIDITVSATLLVLLSPLFAVVSILIKRTSTGPVFFKQQRVGYNGRAFNCLKFRTMIEKAEEFQKDLLKLNEMDGPVFKIKNDPRVTKVGRILRKTSIDELPQLINVLNGVMSLVGPRPPIPSEVNEYDLNTRRRLSIKPGITCLWQVNGRNSLPFEKWMELDRQYIEDWSLGLDFKILAKTIPAVFRGSGAC